MRLLKWCFLAFIPFLAFGQKRNLKLIELKLDSLYAKGNNLMDQKKWEESYDVFCLADSLALTNFGDQSKIYSLACYYRALSEMNIRNFDKAKIYYQKTVDLLKKYGEFQKDYYPNCLRDLGKISADEGDFAQAEKYFLEEIIYRDKQLGSVNEKTGNAFFNLGIATSRGEQYDKAKVYFKNCLAIREKLNGILSVPYSTVIYNLGKLYSALNQYVEADSLLKVSVELLIKLNRKTTPSYVGSLVELSYISLQASDYYMSEKYLMEAYQIYQQNIGLQKHGSYSWSLVTIATYYKNTGQFIKALEFYNKALEIMKASGNLSGWGYYSIHRNIGRIYAIMGDYASSNRILEEVLSTSSLSEQEKEINFPYVKEILYNNYLELGKRIDEKEMTQLFEKLTKKGNYSSVSAHTLLGKWLMHEGKISEAMMVWKNALNISKDSLGMHNIFIPALTSLIAKSYHLLQNVDSSRRYFIWYEEVKNQNVMNASNFMSEAELDAYLMKAQAEVANVSDIIHAAKGDLTGYLYNDALFYKAYLLQTKLIRDKWIREDSLCSQWKFDNSKILRRLSDLYSKDDVNLTDIIETEEKALRLEKQINERLFLLHRLRTSVQWKEVKLKLGKRDLAIEFIRYPGSASAGIRNLYYYAALILRRNDSFPILVHLCSEDKLAEIFSKSSERRLELISSLYNPHTINATDDNLFSLVLKPILPYIKDISTIYYSPIGLLNQIQLSAIPDENGNLLLDNYQLILLSSTRELVEEKIVNMHSKECVLIGGLDYNYTTNDTSMLESFRLNTHVSVRSDVKKIDSSSFKSQYNWKPLPGTLREVEEIEALMKSLAIKSTKLIAKQGTKQNFVRLGISTEKQTSPYVIHIASHAFFESNTPRLSNYSSDSVMMNYRNPMLSSGIVLSGANNHQNEKGSSDTSLLEGVIRSYDIGLMDLQQTELVVLSACETGLGLIHGEEGVYGLQRAFKIAGVNNILMSLWQVPDKQTSELMRQFYSRWLPGKMSASQALRSAQISLKKRGWEPYYWAGFVLME